MGKLTKNVKVNALFTVPAEGEIKKFIFAISNTNSLSEQAETSLKDLSTEKNLIYLVEQYRHGNLNLGIGTKAIPGTCFSKLKAKQGA